MEMHDGEEHINTETKKVKKLEEMFERMEIKVVGRENEDQKSEESFHEDSDDEDIDLN